MDQGSPTSGVLSEAASPPFDMFGEEAAQPLEGREVSTPSPKASYGDAELRSPPFDIFTPATPPQSQPSGRPCPPSTSAQSSSPPFDLFSDRLSDPDESSDVEMVVLDKDALVLSPELEFCMKEFWAGRYRCTAADEMQFVKG